MAPVVCRTSPINQYIRALLFYSSSAKRSNTSRPVSMRDLIGGGKKDRRGSIWRYQISLDRTRVYNYTTPSPRSCRTDRELDIIARTTITALFLNINHHGRVSRPCAGVARTLALAQENMVAPLCPPQPCVPCARVLYRCIDAEPQGENRPRECPSRHNR